jgi:hypothetical protein
MIIDNGDGTYTVRFYTGTYGVSGYGSDGGISAGFTNSNVTADYVTVNRMLPTTSSGMLDYADYGASYTNAANSLWIPLIEKAYTQWNQTGNEGRDGQNAYASIQGGWMATVDAQVLGHNATDYIMTTTSAQVAINALAAHEAVTIGTNSWSGTNLGLYGSHAYAIVGYNASSKTFTLYNPWGSNQPGQLTWAQLQATCSQMAVASTSGSTGFSGVMVNVASVKASLFAEQASDLVAVVPSSESVTTLPSEPASLPAPSGHFRLAASASRALFGALGSKQEMQLHQMLLASSAADNLSAPEVDATFASDGLMPLNDAWATF